MAKLNQKGAKVKLVTDDDDGSKSASTPMKTPKRNTKHDNKENYKESSAPGVDSEKLKELENVQKQQQEIVFQKQQQNEQLQNELQSREQALYLERKERGDLEKLISQMENKLVKGGHGMEGITQENQDQLKKERELQKKLKKQKQKEQELLVEKQRKEEEMLLV
jgi:hypothetical protein